jgi:hypothetical protein
MTMTMSILCFLKRDCIRLSYAPSKPYHELYSNLKCRIRRIYDNEKSYFPFVKEMMKTKEMDVEGFLCSISLEQIDHFEDINPTITVSIVVHEEKELFQLRCPKIIKRFHVDLLSY